MSYNIKPPEISGNYIVEIISGKFTEEYLVKSFYKNDPSKKRGNEIVAMRLRKPTSRIDAIRFPETLTIKINIH